MATFRCNECKTQKHMMYAFEILRSSGMENVCRTCLDKLTKKGPTLSRKKTVNAKVKKLPTNIDVEPIYSMGKKEPTHYAQPSGLVIGCCLCATSIPVQEAREHPDHEASYVCPVCYVIHIDKTTTQSLKRFMKSIQRIDKNAR